MLLHVGFYTPGLHLRSSDLCGKRFTKGAGSRLPSPSFLFEIRCSPGWPGTHDSLASASRVGRITDVCHDPGAVNGHKSLFQHSYFLLVPPRPRVSPHNTLPTPPRPADSLSSTEGLLGHWLDSQAQKPRLGSLSGEAQSTPLPSAQLQAAGGSVRPGVYNSSGGL